MAEKKSILEEALLDAKRIQEALNANTKEILRSIAKEEIDGLVKESLNEEDFEEEDAEGTDDGAAKTDDENSGEAGADDATASSEETDLVPVETGDENSEVGNENSDTNVDNQEIGSELGTGTDVPELGNELDMTNSSDDDVISVYKKLTGDDEIEVVGDDVHLTVSEPGEYVIKGAGAGKTAEQEPAAIGSELGVPELGGENNVDYEIELGNDDDANSDVESGLEPVEIGNEAEATPELDATNQGEEENELDENSVRALNNGRNQSLKPDNFPDDKKGGRVDESKTNSSKLLIEATQKYNKLLNETKGLKKENDEFRTSLKKFRNMLVETVVFNSNLTYAVKLMTEHSTTATEKKAILKRFDEEVSNLKESQKLYKIIKNELTAQAKTIAESVDKKINKEIQSGSSKQLNEATAYVDASTQRINDLIKRVENK